MWFNISYLDQKKPDDMVLAKTEDGRMMMFRVSILQNMLRSDTPNHLQFPATHFISQDTLKLLPDID